MANDPTVKAGSWGAKTVEKIIRIQERALTLEIPMIYLVDSAGARITDQVQMFPGRRGAGRIFHNEVRMSGRVPQVCVLFGPSAAGGAYIPAFCDVVIMRDGNASMYLGSPRMAQMVIGEHVSLEEMGGARMHTSVSGCGHFLAEVRRGGDRARPRVPRLHADELPRGAAGRGPRASRSRTSSPSAVVPGDEKTPFDVRKLIEGVCDAGSFLEVHSRWAKELVVGYARLEGRAIGIVANQPKQKGGVLFVDSADKAARFINTCNAFNVPLLFLADVPGFMIGKAVESQGIIRHGAKMISAVSSATVPKLSVIVRKAYGAGLYAMAGPAFEPDACIALPGAKIAVMGPEAAVNAVYFNQIEAIEDEDEREEFIAAQAGRVLRRHRHPPPRLRAGRRRGDRARRPARRARPPLRRGRGQGPLLHRAQQPDHAGLGGHGSAALRMPQPTSRSSRRTSCSANVAAASIDAGSTPVGGVAARVMARGSAVRVALAAGDRDRRVAAGRGDVGGARAAGAIGSNRPVLAGESDRLGQRDQLAVHRHAHGRALRRRRSAGAPTPTASRETNQVASRSSSSRWERTNSRIPCIVVSPGAADGELDRDGAGGSRRRRRAASSAAATPEAFTFAPGDAPERAISPSRKQATIRISVWGS